MALKVFLSYSLEPEQQVVVWRLQTLAAASGVQLYVPSRRDFRFPSSRNPLPGEEVREAIDRADFVLAIITAQTQPAAMRELDYAVKRKKVIIPIVEKGAADSAWLRRFQKVFFFSASDPAGQPEEQIANFLKQQSATKEQRQALGALVAIGLGMFLLAALAKN